MSTTTRIAFVTGNAGKFATAREHLASVGVELEQVALDLDEIQSSSVCAVRRFVVSPTQSGGTRREVLGSPDLPGGESPMGTRACQGSGGRLEASRAGHRKIRTIWSKLDCLKPNPQR